MSKSTFRILFYLETEGFVGLRSDALLQKDRLSLSMP